MDVITRKLEKLCKNCGKAFISRSKNKKFCCKECKEEYRKKHPCKMKVICPVCGKEFETSICRPYKCCSLSCAQKYRWQNKEYADKILKALEFYRSDPATKFKKSESLKKTLNSPEVKEKFKELHKTNPNMGMKNKKHSDEAKQKMKKAHLGKKVTFTEEHKKNLSKAMTGKKKTALHKQHVKEAIAKRTPEEKKSIVKKVYLTKKQKGTFSGKSKLLYNGIEYKCSEMELYIFTELSKKFIVIPQYKSELYPFNCDFYISDIDLYMEYQGHWTHGKKPYDPNSKNDLKIIEEWKNKNSKFYKHAIEIWSKRDVEKRNLAKENNLNWIEFFNKEEFDRWYNRIK